MSEILGDEILELLTAFMVCGFVFGTVGMFVFLAQGNNALAVISFIGGFVITFLGLELSKDSTCGVW